MKIVAIICLILFALWAFIRFYIAPRIRKKGVLRRFAPCTPYMLPQLPKKLDKTRLVQSRVKGYKKYRVNLYQQTCSCRRFRWNRVYYPEGEIHRLCRHLRRELDQSNLILHYDELTRCIIQSRIKDRCYKKVTLNETDLAIGFSPHNPFVRIYTRRGGTNNGPHGPFTGPYDKFVFNVKQENWVYGEPPPGAHEIINEVKTLFSSFKATRNKYAPDHPMEPSFDPNEKEDSDIQEESANGDPAKNASSSDAAGQNSKTQPPDASAMTPKAAPGSAPVSTADRENQKSAKPADSQETSWQSDEATTAAEADFLAAIAETDNTSLAFEETDPLSAERDLDPEHTASTKR